MNCDTCGKPLPEDINKQYSEYSQATGRFKRFCSVGCAVQNDLFAPRPADLEEKEQECYLRPVNCKR